MAISSAFNSGSVIPEPSLLTSLSYCSGDQMKFSEVPKTHTTMASTIEFTMVSSYAIVTDSSLVVGDC